MKLEGKTALITGGGSGIGLATARLFLEQGARVAISGRNPDRLKQAADSLAAGDRLMYHPADVADVEQVRQLVKQVQSRLGDIHILVNNAGINVKNRAVRDLTPDSWRQQIDTNLNGAFYCVHEVLPGMLARSEGIIVNINSVSGLRSGPLGGIAYNASKFGMRAMAICLAEEVRDAGIRVSTIFPGEVDTPILENRPNPVSEEHRRRILRSEDVAQAVLFVVTMPAHVSIPELVIKPTSQAFI
ncbi:MAG: oxidoreductase [Gemmatales bacterium]|nr:MAG: oxidoreductase [Gemmatales bacterium]